MSCQTAAPPPLMVDFAQLLPVLTMERGLIIGLAGALLIVLLVWWQQRAKMHAREEYYQTILNLATDGIVISQKSVIQYVNARITELTGYSATELVGKRTAHFIMPQAREQLHEWNQRRAETPGQAQQVELTLVHKNGQQIFIEANGANLSINGQQQTLGIVRDITERKEAEAQLQAAATFLREIIDAVPFPIFVRDRDGRFISANEAYAEHQGVPLDRVINHLPQEFLPPETAEQIERITEEIFAGKESSDGEGVIKIGDGRVQHLWNRLRVVQLSSGEEVIVGSVIDISERKALEEEIRYTSEFLSTIMNMIPIPIYVKNRRHEYLVVNKAFAAGNGRQPAEMIGRCDHDLMPAQLADQSRDFAEAMFANGEGQHTERSITRPNGEIQHFLSEVKIGRMSDGEEILVGAVIDISDRKEIEERLREAKEAADLANKAKSTFLSAMTHELRTPMNGVLGMTSLLLDTPLQSEQLTLVETIRASGDALLMVINQILDFSKIEADKLELEATSFYLQTMLEETLDLVAPQATEKGLILAYFLDKNVPRQLIQDVGRLRQILTNLVGNAVKFTEKGEVTVNVAAQPSNTALCQLHFVVRDTGMGIPPEQMDTLFQSFSQADPTISRRFGGTGLGLVISKRLAEAMGGTMWVESTVGQGSAFYFTIQATVESASHAEGSDYPRYGSLDLGRLHGKRILLLTQHETMYRLIEQHLQAWSITLTALATFTAGHEVVASRLTQHEFDAVIVDYAINSEVKEELMCHLAEHVTDLPVVVLTLLGEHLPRKQRREHLAVVTKPVHASQLHDALVNVIYGKFMEGLQSASRPQKQIEQMAEQPLRILVAEDNLVNQRVALGFLSKHGYRADVAANGLEVLTALKRQYYDLILMDINMPEMDGMTATKLLRADADGTQPYIIAMTANAMYEDRKRCLDAGMNDYISKPLRIGELSAALQRTQVWTKSKSNELLAIAADTQDLLESKAQATDRPVDPDALQEFVEVLGDDGEAMVTELMRLYLESGPVLMAEFKQGMKTQTMNDIQHAVHTLSSSSAQIGARRLGALAVELDDLCRRNELPMIMSKADAFVAEYERVMRYFRHEYQERTIAVAQESFPV